MSNRILSSLEIQGFFVNSIIIKFLFLVVGVQILHDSKSCRRLKVNISFIDILFRSPRLVLFLWELRCQNYEREN